MLSRFPALRVASLWPFPVFCEAVCLACYYFPGDRAGRLAPGHPRLLLVASVRGPGTFGPHTVSLLDAFGCLISFKTVSPSLYCLFSEFSSNGLCFHVPTLSLYGTRFLDVVWGVVQLPFLWQVVCVSTVYQTNHAPPPCCIRMTLCQLFKDAFVRNWNTGIPSQDPNIQSIFVAFSERLLKPTIYPSYLCSIIPLCPEGHALSWTHVPYTS